MAVNKEGYIGRLVIVEEGDSLPQYTECNDGSLCFNKNDGKYYFNRKSSEVGWVLINPVGGSVEWDNVQNKPSTFTPSTHSHSESDVTDLVTHLSNKSDTSHTHGGVYEPANSNIQTHVTSGHAPANAQKNSDILKSEIEAVLTGQISTHTHSGGGGSTPDADYYRKFGTTRFEAWYSYDNTGTALTTGALAANRLYAFPFVAPKTMTLDRIAINVTVAGTGNARLGLYNNESTYGMYPGTLLLDAGTVAINATGVKSITINQQLTAGLYWLVLVSNGTPTVRCFAVASLMPLLGYSNTLPTTPYLGMYYSFTYAALPASYGTTPTMITAAPLPAIFVRLSG